MSIIDKFEGHYRFLSNFWPSPVRLRDGFIYPSVEHAYQAAKSEDLKYREKCFLADTAAKVKKIGQKVAIRSDWETVKLSIMKDLVKQKFEIPELQTKLLDTGEAILIEGNWWGDTFWGICKGKGSNHLGKILMDVRTELNRELNQEDEGEA